MMDLGNGEIRQLLTEILRTDADFDAFCQDEFSDVHKRFSGSQDRVSKTSLLLSFKSPKEILEHLHHQYHEATEQFLLHRLIEENSGVVEAFTPKAPDAKLLRRLLPVAIRALCAENAVLARALESSPRPPNRRVALNHSMAYWTSESVLAYAIFKAWLPFGDIDWESSYPGQRSMTADLVAYPKEESPLVFELKWWWDDSSRALKVIHSELEKLRLWTAARKFLLAFWYSPDDEQTWDRERTGLDEFCRNAKGCELAWWAKFPIHHYQGAHYFAMVALAVT